MPQVLDYVAQKSEEYDLQHQVGPGCPPPPRPSPPPDTAQWAGAVLSTFPIRQVSSWRRKIDIAEMEEKRYKLVALKAGRA